MPTAVGPNTKGEENLVFSYDLADVSNSYRGEPTENLITDTAAFGSSFWNQKSGTITANSVTGPRGIQNAAKIVAVNTDPYIYSSAIVTASTGNVTWSIWVRGDGNTVGKSAQVRINFSGTATGTADTNASVNLTSNWQLLQTTANVTGAGTIKFGLEAPNSAVSGDIMYFADPMFEQKSHPTPFTAGTRSATQGLLDLTGNTSINLSTVSFDSNAQMTFDGTSDYINLPTTLTSSFNPNSFTVEAVVNYDSFGALNSSRPYISNWNSWSPGSQKGFILRTYGVSEYASFWWCDGTSYTSINATTQMTVGQHYYIAATYSPSIVTIYVNGVAENTSTNLLTGVVFESTTRIGFGTINTGYFDGKIPIAKIYNRALTASEIKSNYNAIKGRFNI